MPVVHSKVVVDCVSCELGVGVISCASGLVGGTYVQDCDVVGDPPVHPLGSEVCTVLVCVEFDWHCPQVEYVNDVQVCAGVLPV